MTDKIRPLTPLKGRWRHAHHVYLHVAAAESGAALRAQWRRAWALDTTDDGPTCAPLGAWADADGLDALLDERSRQRGPLTLWTQRGYDDLIMTGLAELLDRGVVTYRYVNMSGDKLLLRGSWRGKDVVVASLSNWLGARIERRAPDVGAERLSPRQHQALAGLAPLDPPLGADERAAIGAWGNIAGVCEAFGPSTVVPTAAAGGLGMWRRWLGPTVELPAHTSRRRGKAVKTPKKICVAPLPGRSEACRAAESHITYGLVSRQLRRGRVDGPIHVVDLRCSYWQALGCAYLPIAYSKKLHRPTVEELAGHLDDSVALALVWVRSGIDPYPVRRKHRVHYATGNYWTWLCGLELDMAVESGHVWGVETAHIWSAAAPDVPRRANMRQLATIMDSPEAATWRPMWRTMYSALVGQFAGRRRTWVDVPPRPGVDRWGQWWRADHRSGVIVPCRSIAGRQQELRESSLTSAASPLVYGVVTAWVRRAMLSMAAAAGLGEVLALACDSLWLTDRGLASLREAGELGLCAADGWRVKSTADRVYMDGGSRAIFERGDARVYKCPGVPDATVPGRGDAIELSAAVPWGRQPEIVADAPLLRQRRRHNIARLARSLDHAPEVLSFGEPWDEPLLPDSLTLEYRHNREVIDE